MASGTKGFVRIVLLMDGGGGGDNGLVRRLCCRIHSYAMDGDLDRWGNFGLCDELRKWVRRRNDGLVLLQWIQKMEAEH